MPRQRPEEDIIEEIKSLTQNGYREFILTGINIGKYRGLVELLKRIENLPKVEIVGISSIEPITMTPELIDYALASKKFAKYIHIPLQSGDDNILRSMGRKYTREDFKNLINAIYSKVSDIGIGIDVICGFPGEGEREFMNTYNLLKELPLYNFHIFRFSPRKGTKAYNFRNRVCPNTIKKRAEILNELKREKSLQFRKKFIGRTMKVLVESRMRDGWMAGETSNYIKVLFKGKPDLRGKFLNLKIDNVDMNSTYGTII
jgi:threonylcarbamoyladenosine tRNA methylthiotransferase MtaB